MTPIWYRHWLELRIVVYVVSGLVTIAALFYGLAVSGALEYFDMTGRVTVQVARYASIQATDATRQIVPWAIHVPAVCFVALLVPGLFHGDGLDAGKSATKARVNHPSKYFTASLPLSRERIVGSRLAATFGGVTTILIVSLFAHSLMLLAGGQPVPFIAMARISLLGVVLALGLVAAGAFLTLVVSETLGGLAFFALTMWLWLSQDGWNGVLTFVATSSAETTAAVIGTSLLLIAAALARVRRKDL